MGSIFYRFQYGGTRHGSLSSEGARSRVRDNSWGFLAFFSNVLPPPPPPFGKGSHTAIFGLTTFLLAAKPCRLERRKVFQPKKPLKISKKLSPKTSETVNGLSQHRYPDLWDRGI